MLGVTPENPAPVARQKQPVVEAGRHRQREGAPPRKVSQQEREPARADVDELPKQLGPRERQAAYARPWANDRSTMARHPPPASVRTSVTKGRVPPPRRARASRAAGRRGYAPAGSRAPSRWPA